MIAPHLHTALPVPLAPRLLRKAAPALTRAPSGSGLRRCLVLLDAFAVTSAWALALIGVKPGTVGGGANLLLMVALIVPAAVIAMASQRLYRARVCSVRSVETQRLVRTSAVTAAGALALGGPLGAPVTVHDAAVGAVAMFLLLRGVRSAFGGYLQAGRRRGRFGRPVLLVGANDEAHDLYRLIGHHPELGYEIVGFVADEVVADHPFDLPWLGTVADTEEAVALSNATGVLVAATAVDTAELNRLTRALTEKALHVHLSSGIRGIDQSRLRAQPLAHEPLFYVEPAGWSRWQLAAKRATDIVLAGIGLILAVPVCVVAAIAIKLEDRGPILFRQVRVGRGGRTFTILKLRTMVPGSERLYNELARTHAGRSGPLVKLRDDPRITRVGRILRASSIDELPQLINVLAGAMSMVGPRPNQPVETAALDPGFLAQKYKMRPGLSGLWQVEARDHPSFEVYRRLDLFYLENWSIAFDATILLATARRQLSRTTHLMLPRRFRSRFGPVGSAALP